jgi:threonine dehydrogenase-like Zn-dependent dehydrogenase
MTRSAVSFGHNSQNRKEEFMRALCWHGKNDVRVDTVPDPKIQEPTDVIIKITSTAICGSDLHLYDGFMRGMEKGDVLGHEPMGTVVEVGSSVRKLKKGDRVVVPFVIACGTAFSVLSSSIPAVTRRILTLKKRAS